MALGTTLGVLIGGARTYRAPWAQDTIVGDAVGGGVAVGGVRIAAIGVVAQEQ